MDEETADVESSSERGVSTFDGGKTEDEGGVESERLYLARKEVLEMLRNRGYVVSEAELSQTFSDFRLGVGENLDVEGFRICLPLSSNPEKKILVVFMGSEPVTVEDICSIQSQVSSNVCLQGLILILHSKMNQSVRKELATVSCTVETFMIGDLLLNITKHIGQPKKVGGCDGQALKNASPVIDDEEPVPWDLENANIDKDKTAAEAILCIKDALALIGITNPKFYIFVASPAVSRIAAPHHEFFSTHKDIYNYHVVYSKETQIPCDPALEKKQVSDFAILESLDDLHRRICCGTYPAGQKMVIISGDAGYRRMVDRLKEANMEIFFITPDDKDTKLASGSKSCSLKDIWQGNATWATVEEKTLDSNTMLGLKFAAERKVNNLGIGQSDETNFKETELGKLICSRNPSFTLLNFLLQVQKTIDDVFYSVNKERSITLWNYCKDEQCTQKCAQVFRGLKDLKPKSPLKIVPTSPPQFKGTKMSENNPAIIITFTAKAIFTDKRLESVQEWTMELKEKELKWKLVDMSDF